MLKAATKFGLILAAGLACACVLFGTMGAAPDNQSQPNRYDMDVLFTGKALVLEVIDRQTNTAYIYNRTDKHTYQLKERIDLTQAGNAEIKIADTPTHAKSD